MKLRRTASPLLLIIWALIAPSTVLAENTQSELKLENASLSEETKKEVLASVHQMWDDACSANVGGMFETAPDDHTYVMAGFPLWSKAQALELYEAAFEKVSVQTIDTDKEQVTLLSDSVALYVADMSYTQYDANGQPLESGPYAITLVLKKKNGVWQNIHTHQSFPSEH
ncbi:nuclear transport factor 2 family protein [Vibrio sp. E150_011]